MIGELIGDWIKGILIDGIMGNLSGLFSTVNTKVGEIASDVGTTPQAWNSGIFNMLQSLSDTVIVPIAAAILAVIMCYELIDMIVEKNNMHDFDTSIAKGEADPEGFMVGIEEMTRNLISRYSQISEDAQKLFQTERVVIGKCPRCGEAVYEGKKNYYCGNRACQFVMWKNDRFFEERGKTFTPKIAAALLKDGKAKVKGLRSMKTGKTYDGTVLLADTGGKYVNYRVEKKS